MPDSFYFLFSLASGTIIPGLTAKRGLRVVTGESIPADQGWTEDRDASAAGSTSPTPPPSGARCTTGNAGWTADRGA